MPENATPKTEPTSQTENGDSATASNDRFEKLRQLRASLRSDLTITRQLYRGEPVYLIHDPVNFKNHRFSMADYSVVTNFREDLTLGQVFEKLSADGTIDQASEESYFRFVMRLHALNMLTLPINNGSDLFKRSEATEKAMQRSKLTGFLFIKIPLTNPDGFLARTIPFFKWIFSPLFLAVWLVGVFAAGIVLFSHSENFFEPLSGILAAKNLPFLWLSLIGLKVWHELGHGYACKFFGGRVPEMGAMLLVGTPAAYVDASAAWAFRNRWQRVVVILGGMYFESIIAILAIFVWAFSPNPFLSSCAFQLFAMAGMITVLFNANPLMRYDGYYLLGEFLGIQNLRPQATKQLNKIWKYLFLGIKSPSDSKTTKEKFLLVSFALASGIYKQFLIFGIAFMLAYKFPVIGIAIAGFHISMTLYGLASKLLKYLLSDPETESIRFRARLTAASVFVVLPALMFVIPIPGGVGIVGVLGFENEAIARAQTPGFLEEIEVKPGQAVNVGQSIAKTQNIDVTEALLQKQLLLQSNLLKAKSLSSDSIEVVAKLEPLILQGKSDVRRAVDAHKRLTIRTMNPGRVARVISQDQIGRMLEVGEEVAVIVDGRPLVTAWLTEEDLNSSQFEIGSKVKFRIHGRSQVDGVATIYKVEPARINRMNQLAVTQLAGESILVDPETMEPKEQLFKVQMLIDGELLDNNSNLKNWIDRGAKTSVRFDRKYESIGSWIVRRVHGFIKQVTVDS